MKEYAEFKRVACGWAFGVEDSCSVLTAISCESLWILEDV